MAEKSEDYAVRAAREWILNNCDGGVAYSGCDCLSCDSVRKYQAERIKELAAIVRKYVDENRSMIMIDGVWYERKGE